MADPLDSRTLKHFLDFVSDGFGVVQIDEPVGFDAAIFTIKQDSKRYGRDVSFSGGEFKFTFTNTKNKFGYRFDKIIEFDNIYGYESEIKYLLQDSETEEFYVVGQLDFEKKTTDQITFFSCDMIQSTNQAILKRRNDVKVNLFSDKDLDDNDIDPVDTVNILIKAKPVIQVSKWEFLSTFFVFTGGFADGDPQIFRVNPIKDIVQGTIDNTLSFLNTFIVTFVGDAGNNSRIANGRFDMAFIDAVDDLTNVAISIDEIKISFFIPTGDDFDDAWDIGSPVIRLETVVNPLGLDDYTLEDALENQAFSLDFDVEFIGSENIDRFGDFTGNADRYDVTINAQEFVGSNIPRGHRLSLDFHISRLFTITEWLSGKINISVTSTAIDTVTRGVRLIEAMKQVSKSVNPLFSFTAPRFDLGGEWFDNFVFDGNLIRGRDVAFTTSWKTISEAMQELNADYEIEDTSLSFLKYDDFYTNNDIGAFLIKPDDTFNLGFNERYTINEFEVKYKSFNQDKDDENTIDGIHTEYEALLPNKLVENKKAVSIKWVRDPFLLNTTQRKAASETTTSLTQDDKVFIFDCVQLAPSSTGGFSASLNHNVNNDGELQLLGTGFNWNILGFSITDIFTIVNTDNAGDYNILEITNNIITLDAISVVPETIGVVITEVSYPLSGVQYVIRTNEGFSLIENILAPDNFGNLFYTPKRNTLNNWGSYFKTATKFRQERIKTTFFKNGGELKTQLIGGVIITEKDDIQQEDLPTAILTPRLITVKVLTDFSTYRAFALALKTVRGFVRVFDNENRVLKGYPQKSEFKWADGVLTFDLEEKFESDFTTIVFENDIFIINEVGYGQDIVPRLEYIAEGDHIQFFDSNTRPLTNIIRFDFVTVDGVEFDNIIDLIDAINNLNP